MQFPSTKDFMARVVPWPGPGEPGYINIHWFIADKNDPNKTYMGGRAFTDIDEFLRQAAWGAVNQNIIKDIYFCTSLQKEHGRFSNGKARASRSAPNALAMRAIWLDIDIKEPPKGYTDLPEALHALQIFLKAANLPFPTALVKSGGGLHVYWISDRELPVDEWRQYAEGLKAAASEHHLRCDALVTADAARILRVPGTFNFKTNPPLPVTLGHLDPNDINFATTLSHLAVKVPPRITATVKPEIDMSGFKMSPAFAAIKRDDAKLADGIDTTPNLVLDLKPVAYQCPMWRDALVNGGADHPEPLWQLLVLSSTFFDDGETIAHAIGNKHPGYTPASTEQKYEQKLKQKELHDLGYPSCQAFQSAGCKECATCPLLGKIKSPLVLGITHPVAAPPAQPDTSEASARLHLPGGYFIDEQGIICKWMTSKKEGDYPLPLFLCKVLRVLPRKDPNRGLDLTVEEDMGSTAELFTPQGSWCNQTKMCEILSEGGMKYNPGAKSELEGFFMAWLTELHQAMASVKTRPFGWMNNHTEFAFGGSIFARGASPVPCGITDPQLRREYQIIGERQPWHDALHHIVAQKRPHLEIIIASAFAAPIIEFAGAVGGTLSPWGESGTNKSSAVRVALAVWGDPQATKLPPQSTTAKGLEGRLALLDCLPVTIDDAQTYADFKKAAETVFLITQGASGARMMSNTRQRERGTWKTMMVLTANHSLHRYMIDVKKTRTTAELARAFEIIVPPPNAQTPGRTRDTVTEPLFNKLVYHHGVIGGIYAQWLVDNIEFVNTETKRITNEFADLVQQQREERFWTALCGSMIAGATFANMALGTTFDVDAMRVTLVKEYYRNRKTVDEAQVEGNTVQATENVFHDFLIDKSEHQMWTGAIESGSGVAKGKKLSMLFDCKRSPLLIHWDVAFRRVHIDKGAFEAFCIEREMQLAPIMQGLKDNFGAKTKKWRLGSGTMHSHSPTNVIEIKIGEGHELEFELFKPVPDDQVPPHILAARELGQDDTAFTATVIPGSDAAPVSLKTVVVPTGLAAAQAQAASDLETVRKAT